VCEGGRRLRGAIPRPYRHAAIVTTAPRFFELIDVLVFCVRHRRHCAPSLVCALQGCRGQAHGAPPSADWTDVAEKRHEGCASYGARQLWLRKFVFYHAQDAVCLDSMKPSPNMSLQMPGARVTLFCHSFFPSVVAGLCLWPWSLLFGSEAEACPPAGAYTALTPLMLACLRAPACSSE
jgi:hypothetical protein